jgi:hypothetical protein
MNTTKLLRRLSAVIVIACSALIVQAQNTFPNAGAVGIGTTSPDYPFEVACPTKISGPLTVDSAMTINEEVQFNGEVKFAGLADSTPTAGASLLQVDETGMISKVSGLGTCLRSLCVDSVLKVGTNSLYFFGNSPSNPNNHIFGTDGPLIINGFTTTVVPQSTSINPTIGSVGIGFLPTAIPAGVKLAVGGTLYGTSFVGFGTLPSADAQLKVRTTGNNKCLVLEHTQSTSGYNYGILETVSHPETKAFGITLSDNNGATQDPETFHILGDGRTMIGPASMPGDVQLAVRTARATALTARAASNSSQYTAIVAEVPGDDARAFAIRNLSNASAPLDVLRITGQGRIWCQEVNVRIAPFPDYVFEPGYALTGLDQLQQHIDQHGRLPHMPSAAEVEAQGAQLGELVRLQQEKIEELSLYILQLHDRLKTLEAK